jgi:hypothetical protein
MDERHICERWTKGISGAIGMMLGAAFLLYSFDRSGRGDSEVYFIAGGFVGLAYLLGWLAGSKEDEIARPHNFLIGARALATHRARPACRPRRFPPPWSVEDALLSNWEPHKKDPSI